MMAFRKELSKRMGWMIAGCVVATAAVLFFAVQAWNTQDDTHIGGFILGVQTGLFFGVLAVLAQALLKYRRALRDEAALEKLYVAQTDERTRFICDKIGGIGMNAMLVMMALATVVAGFFNTTVFFTLLAVFAASAFTKAGLKLYFAKKY